MVESPGPGRPAVEDVEDINRKVQSRRRDSRERCSRLPGVGKWDKGLERLLMETGSSYMMRTFWNYLVKVTGHVRILRTLWLCTCALDVGEPVTREFEKLF